MVISTNLFISCSRTAERCQFLTVAIPSLRSVRERNWTPVPFLNINTSHIRNKLNIELWLSLLLIYYSSISRISNYSPFVKSLIETSSLKKHFRDHFSRLTFGYDKWCFLRWYEQASDVQIYSNRDFLSSDRLVK